MTNEPFDPNTHRKGWAIPNFGFLDFSEPVTYEEALKQAEEIKQKLFGATK